MQRLTFGVTCGLIVKLNYHRMSRKYWKENQKVVLPNINRALNLLAGLPVTAYSCERSTSALEGIEIYLRSTMHQVIITVLQYFIPPSELTLFA